MQQGGNNLDLLLISFGELLYFFVLIFLNSQTLQPAPHGLDGSGPAHALQSGKIHKLLTDLLLRV
ncbi:hypothetical protein D3C74_481720 [compost metagenome]